MQKNKLWNTGLEVTKICLGTMTWGYQNTEEEAHEQLDYAIKEAGINFIDTAELYAIPPREHTQWLTEKYIWTWFSKNPSYREKVILASKMAWFWIPWVREWKWLIASDMEAAVNWSLERLQTDYIDLYQFHRPQRNVNRFGKMNYEESWFTSKEQEENHIIELLKAFEKLQKEWKVRHLGLSNETPWGTMKFLQIAEKYNLPKIQTVQNPYNLLNRQYEVWMSEISLFENVWLLAYSPLAGGILSWKYKNWNLPKWSRYELYWKERQPQNYNERTLSVSEELECLALKNWMSLVQMALAWVNTKWFVHSNIIWATTMEQLKEDISSADIILSDEILKEIDEMFTIHPNTATF